MARLRSHPLGHGGKKEISTIQTPYALPPQVDPLEGRPGPGDHHLVLTGTNPTSWAEGASAIEWEDVGTSGGGGGIQFDTDPQSGGFLLLDTTGTLPSGIGSGYGIVLRPSDGMMVYTPSSVYVEGDGGISLTSNGGNIGISSSTGSIHIAADTTLDLSCTAWEITDQYAALSAMNITAHFGPVLFNLASTYPFTIRNSAGDKVFEIRDDNTAHVKTGTTWAADL